MYQHILTLLIMISITSNGYSLEEFIPDIEKSLLNRSNKEIVDEATDDLFQTVVVGGTRFAIRGVSAIEELANGTIFLLTPWRIDTAAEILIDGSEHPESWMFVERKPGEYQQLPKLINELKLFFVNPGQVWNDVETNSKKLMESILILGQMPFDSNLPKAVRGEAAFSILSLPLGIQAVGSKLVTLVKGGMTTLKGGMVTLGEMAENAGQASQGIPVVAGKIPQAIPAIRIASASTGEPIAELGVLEYSGRMTMSATGLKNNKPYLNRRKFERTINSKVDRYLGLDPKGISTLSESDPLFVYRQVLKDYIANLRSNRNFRALRTKIHELDRKLMHSKDYDVHSYVVDAEKLVKAFTKSEYTGFVNSLGIAMGNESGIILRNVVKIYRQVFSEVIYELMTESTVWL